MRRDEEGVKLQFQAGDGRGERLPEAARAVCHGADFVTQGIKIPSHGFLLMKSKLV